MSTAGALQDWLALEHEAVWLLPIVGARFGGDADRAAASVAAHRTTRDGVLARLAAQGVEPEPARLSYGLPPTSSGRARRAVRDLESRITAACLTLAGESDGDLRAYAVTGVRRASLAGLGWGAAPESFPGLA